MTPDTEITLTAGELRLTVSPYGASLRGLAREAADGQREEIIAGYSGAANKKGGQGDVLIPFPGRVANGLYTFDGQTHQMEKNDKDGPNAIHGFLRSVLWQPGERSDSSMSFTTEMRADEYATRGYPFSLRAEVAYRLLADGLTVELGLTNLGDTPAPVAAGFHPYFTVGSSLIDEDTLQVPFESYLEFNEALIPTGNVLSVEGTPFDFREACSLGSVVINTCYVGPRRDADGLLRVRLSSPDTGRTLAVWMDETFNYVVLYSGDPLPEPHRRRALAIEPMTCASDAFNRPDWGLVSLAPNATLSGKWGVEADGY